MGQPSDGFTPTRPTGTHNMACSTRRLDEGHQPQGTRQRCLRGTEVPPALANRASTASLPRLNRQNGAIWVEKIAPPASPTLAGFRRPRRNPATLPPPAPAAGGDPLTAADTPGQVVGSLGQPPGLGAPCPCVRAHVWLVRGAALGVGGVERCTPPKEIYGLFLGRQH